MEQQVYFDAQSLKDILQPYNGGNLFLVTGRNSYEKHVFPIIKEFLQSFSVTRYYDFKVNPSIEDALRGLALFNNHDLILAVGGGSVIDMAKLINGGQSASENNTLLDICTKKATANKGVPLIAIPTTAGSGSEATSFAVVYIDGKKHSFESANIKPDVAIIDPLMSNSMPPYLTACTGFDALSQAVEAFWSVNSSTASKKDAIEAITLILPVLKKAVNSPDGISREQMSKGAYLAGKVINVTKTTAPHAMSYYMTQKYSISHGHGVALFLGRYFLINSPAAKEVLPRKIIDPRGKKYLTQNMEELFSLFGVDNGAKCQKFWFKLMTSCGLETDLGMLGLGSTDAVDCFFNNINEARLKNNPVQIDFEFLKKLWFPALYN